MPLVVLAPWGKGPEPERCQGLRALRCFLLPSKFVQRLHKGLRKIEGQGLVRVAALVAPSLAALRLLVDGGTAQGVDESDALFLAGKAQTGIAIGVGFVM